MNAAFHLAISKFGSDAKAKLTNVAVVEEPEDQLRSPLEHLIVSLAELCGYCRRWRIVAERPEDTA